LQRIQCSEIREALNDHFGQEINDNEMGAIVREAFPGVIRKRSNSVHYYENISLKVSKLDEEVQVDEHVQVNGEHAKIGLKDEGTQVDLTGGLYDADISSVPKCMIISRNQLVSDDPETVLGKGAYGEVSFQTYQGMAVAVKKYKNCSKEDVVRELLTVLNIRPCMFLPIVYGVSTERRPFLMILKFYGSLSTKRSTTLQYYLKKYSRSSAKNGNNSSCSFPAASTSNIPKNDRELLQVAENICEGLDHIHKCGYLHGDIKSNNILIIKQDSNVVPKIIDFGKSCMISSPSYSCVTVKSEKEYESAKLKYPHLAKELFFGKPRSIETDIFAYGILLREILNTLNKNNTEFNVLLEQALSDRPENRPVLTCIKSVINKQ
jgi:hypothetical protein